MPMYLGPALIIPNYGQDKFSPTLFVLDTFEGGKIEKAVKAYLQAMPGPSLVSDCLVCSSSRSHKWHKPCLQQTSDLPSRFFQIERKPQFHPTNKLAFHNHTNS